MDEAEGFFPERRLLAYRRSRLRAAPVPTKKHDKSAWWIVLVCLVPSYIPIGTSLFAQDGHLIPILIYPLLACGMIVAVAGVCFGTYRGLRTHKRLTRK